MLFLLLEQERKGFFFFFLSFSLPACCKLIDYFCCPFSCYLLSFWEGERKKCTVLTSLTKWAASRNQNVSLKNSRALFRLSNSERTVQRETRVFFMTRNEMMCRSFARKHVESWETKSGCRMFPARIFQPCLAVFTSAWNTKNWISLTRHEKTLAHQVIVGIPHLLIFIFQTR